jgi:hypothetical protein
MGLIPTENIVAVIHLAFVGAFVGLYLCEVVLETYGFYKKEFSHSAIKCHYLLDVYVELPLITGVIISGITMAIFVGKFSGFHLALIICGLIAGLYCPFMFLRYVRPRNREINKETPDEKFLDAKMKEQNIMANLIFHPAFFAVLILGFWLAYHRVLESIYG